MAETPGPVETTLLGIRELLAVPERWTKGWFARSATGSVVGSHDPSAVCWCWKGAAWLQGDESQYDGAHDTFLKANGIDAAELNDAPDTTHADILSATDKAIQYARDRGL